MVARQRMRNYHFPVAWQPIFLETCSLQIAIIPRFAKWIQMASSTVANFGLTKPLRVSGCRFPRQPFYSGHLQLFCWQMLTPTASSAPWLETEFQVFQGMECRNQCKSKSHLSVMVDSTGNIFIADTYNARIRKVGTNGIISTIAGNGTQGFAGDGGRATMPAYPCRKA